MSGPANPIHPLLAPLAHVAKEATRARTGKSPARLASAMRLALRQHESWLRPEHRVGDTQGYMRHLLYTDAEGDFVVTVITWLPGQRSPVHGHRVWCAFGVVDGEMSEEQFCVARGLAPGPPEDHGLRRRRNGGAGPGWEGSAPRLEPRRNPARVAAPVRRIGRKAHHRHQQGFRLTRINRPGATPG